MKSHSLIRCHPIKALSVIRNFQATKLVAFYDMLDVSSLSFARRSVVWRGVLALMLVHVRAGLDISFLAERMVPSFQAAVRYCVTLVHKNTHRVNFFACKIIF